MISGSAIFPELVTVTFIGIRSSNFFKRVYSPDTSTLIYPLKSLPFCHFHGDLPRIKSGPLVIKFFSIHRCNNSDYKNTATRLNKDRDYHKVPVGI